jgi:hypothetical protein
MCEENCDQVGDFQGDRPDQEQKTGSNIPLVASEFNPDKFSPDLLPELWQAEEIPAGMEPLVQEEHTRKVNSSSANEQTLDLANRVVPADSGSNTAHQSLESWTIGDLAASDVTCEDAKQLKIVPVTANEVNNIVGFRAVDCHGNPVEGYAIPFIDPVTAQPMLCMDECRPFIRVKLRNPAVLPGSSAKYLSPKQAGQRAYIMSSVHQSILAGAPVLLTEGEKKSICATQRGLPVIGLTGIWGWRDTSAGTGVNHDRLLPELARYAQAGTTWTLIFDSDAALPEKQKDFKFAAARLAKVLAGHGISLGLVVIPQHVIQQYARL